MTASQAQIPSTTLLLLGWLMYPMIRLDFSKREKRRLALIKTMAESGELYPDSAEQASTTV